MLITDVGRELKTRNELVVARLEARDALGGLDEAIKRAYAHEKAATAARLIHFGG